MLTVHLRITDAATGTPTAARLRITGPDGAVYFPFGSHHEFPFGRNEDVGGRVLVAREAWVYVDGSCEIRLPSGVPLRVRIEKGPEYTPLDETVTLGPGQMALRFAVRRWSNLRETGWFPGDTRVHFLPPHAARLEAAAEDLAVVNLLACETAVPSQAGETYLSAPHLTAFSGQAPALASESAAVAVNTLNVHPVLGRVALLHAHRVIFPLRFGGPDYPDDWSVCDWCDQCHRKNGLAVWVEPFADGQDGEALVATVLGKVDAVEYDGRTRPASFLPQLYRLWNLGVRLALVGGSGKDSNRVPCGGVRTFAELGPGEPFTYTNWVNAVRNGRTFATTGPLVSLTVGPAGPGETAELVEPGRLPVVAQAESRTPFDRLEVVANGEVIGSASPRENDGKWLAFVGIEHAPTESGWVAARVVGASAFAHTSPVRVRLAGHPPRPASPAPLVARIERTREWAETAAHYTDEKWKRQLLANCAAAVAKLTVPPAADA
jgi:hypothetical protein